MNSTVVFLFFIVGFDLAVLFEGAGEQAVNLSVDVATLGLPGVEDELGLLVHQLVQEGEDFLDGVEFGSFDAEQLDVTEEGSLGLLVSAPYLPILVFHVIEVVPDVGVLPLEGDAIELFGQGYLALEDNEGLAVLLVDPVACQDGDTVVDASRETSTRIGFRLLCTAERACTLVTELCEDLCLFLCHSHVSSPR